MAVLRTNRTCASAAIADAAFALMCESLIAAPRSVSPNRPFSRVNLV
jgi:hypothetical protein